MYFSVGNLWLNSSIVEIKVKLRGYIGVFTHRSLLQQRSNFVIFPKPYDQQKRTIGTDNRRKIICQQLTGPHTHFEMSMSQQRKDHCSQPSVLTAIHPAEK